MTEHNPNALSSHEQYASRLRNGLLAGVAVVGALVAGVAETEPAVAANVPAVARPSHHYVEAVGQAQVAYHPVEAVSQAHVAK